MVAPVFPQESSKIDSFTCAGWGGAFHNMRYSTIWAATNPPWVYAPSSSKASLCGKWPCNHETRVGGQAVQDHGYPKRQAHVPRAEPQALSSLRGPIALERKQPKRMGDPISYGRSFW